MAIAMILSQEIDETFRNLCCQHCMKLTHHYREPEFTKHPLPV